MIVVEDAVAELSEMVGDGAVVPDIAMLVLSCTVLEASIGAINNVMAASVNMVAVERPILVGLDVWCSSVLESSV